MKRTPDDTELPPEKEAPGKSLNSDALPNQYTWKNLQTATIAPSDQRQVKTLKRKTDLLCQLIFLLGLVIVFLAVAYMSEQIEKLELISKPDTYWQRHIAATLTKNPNAHQITAIRNSSGLFAIIVPSSPGSLTILDNTIALTVLTATDVADSSTQKPEPTLTTETDKTDKTDLKDAEANQST